MFNSLNQQEPSDYTGLFIGKVVDNKDPRMLQRVKVEIPNLTTGAPDSLPWCFPAQHSLFGMTESAYSVGVPVIGSYVVVEFQGGDLNYGCVSSCLHTAKTSVSGELATNYPNRRGWLDPAGNLFFIDITGGQVVAKFLHKSGTSITIQDNGRVIVNSVEDIEQSCQNMRIKVASQLSINAGTIVAAASTTTVNSNIATSGTLTNNGVDVSSTHTHGGVVGGPGSTSVPN